MRNIIAFLLLVMSLSSCNSDTESKGINSVLNFYGGEIVYSKGIVRTTDDDEIQGSYYEIKLKPVDRIKQYFNTYELPASNCAYLFYRDLSNKEKAHYSFVRILIEVGGTESKYEFETKELADVESAVALSDRVIDSIKKQDYSAFAGMGSLQAASQDDWDKSKNLMLSIDSKYGDVNDFSMQGFESLNRNLPTGVKHLLKLSGILIRKKQSTDFSFIVEPTALRNEKYLYGFAFSK